MWIILFFFLSILKRYNNIDFFYTTVDYSFIVYCGRDKHETEELIKYGWDEDVWFHVDKLSSAHVYQSLKDDMTLDDIPEQVGPLLMFQNHVQ